MMVVNMFTAEHAENTESQDNHLGSSYNPASPLDRSRVRVPVVSLSFYVISALSAISAVSINDNFQNAESKKIEGFKYCRI